ncbi:UNVERIFIED_CONTAM: hypothetical protein Sradi_5751800 [Sesamum radiatum]|uniref:Uncharacterized protein n=1 Tax=Sesamum radiatum TaxID=300843 RepID=A0AAW2L5F1_SESRA
MGQLVSIVSRRKEGQVPSDTKKNPREQVNAISVRNDRVIGGEPPKEQVEEAQAQKEEESQEETKGSPLKLILDAIPPYIPYPKRILKANLDKQLEIFLEILKKVHVNIPLIDVILHMLSSAKFLKEVLSTKRKWEGGETVKLNEECSTILQNKLPPKLKDPGSFSIPCTIGNIDFDKVLCDLGASDMKEEHEEVPNFVDTGQEVKSKLQMELLLNGSTSNPKVKPSFEASSDRKKASEDKWCQPNIMKRWRNQVDKNVGFYKEHNKGWNASHIRKKKFKDGDKRHHTNNSPIKVDWQRLKHYIEGTPPPVGSSPQLPQITSLSTN